MILVITKNSDPTTSTVCYWLIHFGKKFQIISEEDEVELVNLKKGDLVINNISRNYTLNFSEIQNIFYRQGDMFVNRDIIPKDKSNLADFLNRERKVLHEFIHNKISQIKHLGHPLFGNLNKLVILEKAEKAGLSVPNYIYTTSKTSLHEFIEKHPKVISKSILPGYFYEKEDSIYASFTEALTYNDIRDLGNTFYPTFFQELINKTFEVRAFYLDNVFYSIAIISQNNDKTKIDYRNYDNIQPNRNVPFQLPQQIEQKLKVLINELSLKYCSVDLIYGDDENFHFLEINPVGQFGNVSYFGNYFLEMKIANLL